MLHANTAMILRKLLARNTQWVIVAHAIATRGAV